MKTQKETRPFTGRHMALIMTSFFAVVIGVNLSMAVLARSTWTGLLVPNTYVASQNFNAETKKLEALREKGVALNLSYIDGTVFSTFTKPASQDLVVKFAVLTLGRRVAVEHDREVAMNCNGLTCAAIANLLPGLWRGEITVTLKDADVWHQPVEILVKDK